MARLADILKSGELRDNQRYAAADGTLSNRRWPEPITLWPEGGENAWSFLVRTAREVSELLQEKPADAVVFFNEGEYEHNTADEFLRLHGTDAFNFQLSTGNLIGCVRRGEHSVRISSRFGDAFLRYIIADADGFLELENFGGEQRGGDYDWLLAYLWMIKLRRAFRLGLPKQYASREETTAKVRGTIDPVRYVLDGDRAAYLCRYREHSYGGPAAILISEAYRRIRGYEFARSVHTIGAAFTVAAEGKRMPLRELLNTRPFTNPFYADYNGVLELSKRVLRNEAADFGEKSKTSAFFFDVSMLFEYFVRKLIHRAGAQMQSKQGGPWAIPTGGLSKPRRKLEPDLVFELDGKPCVFDVKYKAFDFSGGVSREDLFQMHTYVGQISNGRDVAACGLIYPVSQENWERRGLEASGGLIADAFQIAGKRVPFYAAFLRVPPEGAEFGLAFKAACDVFVQRLREAVGAL